MKRCLVGAKIDVDAFGRQSLPKVNYVAHVCERYGFFTFDGLADAGDELVQVIVQFIYPSLLVALAGGLRIDFRRYAYHTGNVARLGLGARHTSQTGRHKEHPASVVPAYASLFELFAGCVHNGNGSAVHNALGADVHVRSGGHLPVLAHSEGVEFLPMVLRGVIGDDHAVGDNNTWRILMRGEQSQWMP